MILTSYVGPLTKTSVHVLRNSMPYNVLYFIVSVVFLLVKVRVLALYIVSTI